MQARQFIETCCAWNLHYERKFVYFWASLSFLPGKPKNQHFDCPIWTNLTTREYVTTWKYTSLPLQHQQHKQNYISAKLVADKWFLISYQLQDLVRRKKCLTIVISPQNQGSEQTVFPKPPAFWQISQQFLFLQGYEYYKNTGSEKFITNFGKIETQNVFPRFYVHL